MTTYSIDVYRDGKFWMIRVPELDGTHGLVGEAITQARRVSDVESEARDYICTVIDAAPSAVDIDVCSVRVDGIDVLADARIINEVRQLTQQLERAAATRTAQFARDLADHTVPVRDIGELLGISHQRAHQVIATRDTHTGDPDPVDPARVDTFELATVVARHARAWRSAQQHLAEVRRSVHK